MDGLRPTPQGVVPGVGPVRQERLCQEKASRPVRRTLAWRLSRQVVRRPEKLYGIKVVIPGYPARSGVAAVYRSSGNLYRLSFRYGLETGSTLSYPHALWKNLWIDCVYRSGSCLITRLPQIGRYFFRP